MLLYWPYKFASEFVRVLICWFNFFFHLAPFHCFLLKRPISFFDEPWFYFVSELIAVSFEWHWQNWLIESTEFTSIFCRVLLPTPEYTFLISIATGYNHDLFLWFIYWIFHVFFDTINDKVLMNCLQALCQRPVNNFILLWMCSELKQQTNQNPNKKYREDISQYKILSDFCFTSEWKLGFIF